MTRRTPDQAPWTGRSEPSPWGPVHLSSTTPRVYSSGSGPSTVHSVREVCTLGSLHLFSIQGEVGGGGPFSPFLCVSCCLLSTFGVSRELLLDLEGRGARGPPGPLDEVPGLAETGREGTGDDVPRFPNHPVGLKRD